MTQRKPNGEGRRPLAGLESCGLVAGRIREVPSQAYASAAVSGIEIDRILWKESGGQPGPQIVVATCSAGGDPTVGQCRAVLDARRGQKNSVVVVAIGGASGWWIQKSSLDARSVGPLSEDVAERILCAALGEGSTSAFADRLTSLLNASDREDGLVGLTNQGLFATHYLTRRLPGEPAWEAAGREAAPLLDHRDVQLLDSLGYAVEKHGSGGLRLLSDKSEPTRRRAIAVLLNRNESFEGSSARFQESPVALGLARAQQHEIDWLLVLRGSQIRLYSARPGVGVGSRGLADTFFELDLAILPATQAAFAHLVFSASALAPEGSVQNIIEASRRYAAELGTRLRQRIYEIAIPDFAVAVADAIARADPERGDDLDYAYHVTLRILFRVLFQAYAEDRGLLPYQRNQRYDRYALKERALDLAEDRPLAAESNVLWAELKIVWQAIDRGNEAWDLPAYNGGLFGEDPDRHPEGATIRAIDLNDAEVGALLRGLLLDETDDGARGPVDFREMSVREFGTIYEGLLESSLSRAVEDLALDAKGTYVPTRSAKKVVVAAGRPYFENTKGQRKASGTYFTPSFVVEHLLQQGLGPALNDHLDTVRRALDEGDQAGAAERFFDFSVADIAMGSAHFLVSAIDHIEARMSAFLAEHPVPAVTNELRRLEMEARRRLGVPDASDGESGPETPYSLDPSSLLRRQIARRCVYGVDINPLAVELARVAVWLHTFVPGLPMSTLDRNLVAGDALTGIGTVDDALRALDPAHGEAQLSAFTELIEDALSAAEGWLREARQLSEASKAEVEQSAELYAKADQAMEQVRLLFDLAVAKTVDASVPEVHDRESALAVARSEPVAQLVQELMSARLDSLAHLPSMFPEAFARANPGFDVLVGNPPWEKVKVEKHGWWLQHIPGLFARPVADRNKKISRLRKRRMDLDEAFKAANRERKRHREHLRRLHPQLGKGDTDLYAAFGWRYWQLLRDSGRLAVVLPRSALGGSGMEQWRRTLLTGGAFTDVVTLINAGQWVFAGLDGRYAVGLIAVRRGAVFAGKVASLQGPYHSLGEWHAAGIERAVTMRVEQILEWSESAAFPSIPTKRALQILMRMKAVGRPAAPAPSADAGSALRAPMETYTMPTWCARAVAELHSSSDRHRFILDGGEAARTGSSTRRQTDTDSTSTPGSSQ